MKWPLWRRRQDADLSEELRSHLALAVQDRIDRGESPEQAASAARREFGNVLLIQETVRDMWGWTSIQQCWQDLNYARRALWKARAFGAAAILTLSLGIGANTAMFSIVRAVVLRPLPFAAPEQLIAVNETDSRTANPRPLSASWPDVVDWRRDTQTLASLAGYHTANFTVTGRGPSRIVPGAVVSANLFTTLGVLPYDGRAFLEEEERVGSDVVVISDEFRRNHLADVANPVGSAITVNGRRVAIVGVMPAAFTFPIVSPPVELWVTMAEDARVEAPGDTPMTAQRGAHFLQTVGRMKPGAGLASVQAEFSRFTAALAQDDANEHRNRGAVVTTLHDAIVGNTRAPLLLLLAAVSCVLVIACVNLANLMTARGVTRQPELALRVALGASRSRVIRLVMAESAVIAIVSAIGGIVIAWWSLDVFVALAPREVRGLQDVSIDTVVLAYTAMVAGLCALLVGVMPALRATRGDLRADIGAERTSGGSRSQRRWLRGLIVTETAVGAVLLAGATLVITGLDRLSRTDPGFDVATVSTMKVNLPDSRYPFAKQVAFYDGLLLELARLPGIESAAIVGPLPLSGARFSLRLELPGGGEPVNGASQPSAGFAFISPGYFKAMRIPIRMGREFTTADNEAAPRTAIVNESFARQFFPGESPIGKRIRPGLSTTEAETPWREIVGVVSDIKQQTLNEPPAPAMYVPHAHGLITTPHIVVRSAGTVDAVPEIVRRVILAADPELAIYDVRTLGDRLGQSVATQRFTTFLLTLFASLAVLLIAVGLYGVLAHGVAQRTHEFGVRLALGASPTSIVVGVVKGAIALVGGGLLVGLLAAAGLAQVLIAALDFVEPPSVFTFGAVAMILLGVAAAAVFAPARKAMRVDPMQTLRAR
jgi:putative ABC transport system permease protein